jgi:hypothetical protein
MEPLELLLKVDDALLIPEFFIWIKPLADLDLCSD